MDTTPGSAESVEQLSERRAEKPRGDGGGRAPGSTAAVLAAALHDAREELVRRWLERITARVTVSPNRIFPTEELLNHVPILIAPFAIERFALGGLSGVGHGSLGVEAEDRGQKRGASP